MLEVLNIDALERRAEVFPSVKSASTHAPSESRVTQGQLSEVNNKIDAVQKEQNKLLEAFNKHLDSNSEGDIELCDLRKATALKIASLEDGLSKNSADVSKLTITVDDQTEELRKMALDITKGLSLIQEQRQSMFNALMTLLVGNHLELNSTIAKVDELIIACREGRDIDPDAIKRKAATNNIEAAKENSILAEKAGFPETAQALLQLGLRLAEQSGLTDLTLETQGQLDLSGLNGMAGHDESS